MQLLIYYTMGEDKSEISLAEFNRKLSFATAMGIRFGAYDDEREKYRFVHGNYTCVAFTVSSFKLNQDDANWDKARFSCDAEVAELEEYDPVARGAQYLAIVKVMMAGDDAADSQRKVTQLTNMLNSSVVDANLSLTASARRLSEARTDAFIGYCERCMNSEPIDPDVDAECNSFLGLDLDDFKS